MTDGNLVASPVHLIVFVTVNGTLALDGQVKIRFGRVCYSYTFISSFHKYQQNPDYNDSLPLNIRALSRFFTGFALQQLI